MKAGWEVKPLGDVIELISGQHINASDYNNSNKGIGYLTGPSDYGPIHPVITKWTEFPKRLAQCGDILLTVKGSGVGSVNLLDAKEVAISRQIMAVRAKAIEPRYLFLLLQSLQAYFAEKANGAAIPGISRCDVTDFACHLPPHEEQKRIVAVLDAAFEGLARAKENAETNLQNARELFESTLSFLFSQSEGWNISALNDHVAFVDYRGKTPPKREAGVRLITAKNVKRGFVQVEPKEFIDEGAYDAWMTRGFPEEGDVLFTTEAPLANVAQLDTSEKVVIGQRLITMKPDRAKIDREFLKFALMSPQMQEEIFSYATGATVLGIKAKLLKTVKFRFPKSLERQRKVAAQCRTSFEKMDELDDIYRTKLADIADLRQSLLQKAFAGELT